MATLQSIRKRIVSVKNTQKITKAMKMVAAAKLRRAQNHLNNAKPYAAMLKASLIRLIEATESWSHPLVTPREPEAGKAKAHLLVFTSDRGLCGGFNGNLLRQVDKFFQASREEFPHFEFSTVGKKGRDYYRSKRVETRDADFLDSGQFSFEQAQELAKKWMQRYQEGDTDRFFIAYNAFQSAISQVPTVAPVFPLNLETGAEAATTRIPVKWEGEANAILEQMLQRYVATLFYIAVLESQASELGARMSAMENATNNAREMIGSLTLQYNRARQAAITTELMDIVNGAEALG